MIYFIGYDHCAMWAQERYQAFKLRAYSLTQTVEQFDAALSQMPPGSAVLLSGQVAFSIAQGQGWYPKNRKVSTHAGQVKYIADRRVHIIPCIDTLDIDNNPHKVQQLDYFITLAHRVVTTGNAAPDVSAYSLEYADTLDECLADIDELFDGTRRVPVSVDLETMGLDAFNPDKHIVTLQVSTRPDRSRVAAYPSAQVWLQLQKLLNDPRVAVIGANLTFDLLWLRHKHGIECSNYVFDCMVVDSLIDNKRPHNLETMTKHYCPDIGGYDDAMNALDKSVMNEHYQNDPEGFLIYSGMDTVAALRVFQAQRAELVRDPKLTRFYNEILHPAGIELMNHEYTGLHVDGNLHEEIREEFVTKSAECFRTAFNHLKVMDRAKHSDKTKFTPTMITDYLFGPRYLNLKPQQKTATGKIATSEAALRKVKAESAQPFIDAILDQGKYNKIVSTYLDGFSQHIRHDGWYHPSYLQAWTNTGRLSASSPAILCVAKGTKILTDSGEVPIEEIVADRLQTPYRVKTHTGAWCPVVGLYSGGVQDVYTITFDTGQQITATENHALYTGREFIKVKDLKRGQRIARHEQDDNASSLASYEKQMLQPQVSRLERLRGQGYRSLRALAEFFSGVLSRYGADARRAQRGTQRREQGVLSGELLLHPDAYASEEQTRHCANNLQRGIGNAARIVVANRHTVCEIERPVLRGETRAGSGAQWGFTTVQSIAYAKKQQTYDLTVADSHSYVANGIVSHNTIPKHSAYARRLRECYTPPPGYEILGVDFDSGELYIHAHLSNNLAMQKTLAEGGDIHEKTGRAFYEAIGLDPNENPKKTRQSGKPGNFGIIYLISPPGLVMYAEQFGVSLVEETAATFIDLFFRDNPAVPVYHEVQKQIVERDGRVQSPLGRWRQLPEVRSNDHSFVRKAYRAAVNFPTQATLSDCNQWACAILGKEYPQLEQFLLFHDAIYFYIEKGSADYWMPKIRDVMENLPLERFQMYMNVGLRVSFELYREHWGHAVEFNRDGTEKTK